MLGSIFWLSFLLIPISSSAATRSFLPFEVPLDAENLSPLPSTPVAKSDSQEMPKFQPWADTKDLFSTRLIQNSSIFAGSVLSVIGAHQLDPSMREYFAHQHRIGNLENLGNEVLGTGVPGIMVASSLWYWGEKAQSAYEVRAGQAQIEALAGTALFTFALKGIVHRDRPDNSDAFSFPSGHTSTMAASAMALQDFYGWKLGVPMFALTVLTAASRMSADVHWFSDTIAGAGVGLIFGHAFARLHLDRLGPKKSSEIQIMPLFLPGQIRIVSTFDFNLE